MEKYRVELLFGCVQYLKGPEGIQKCGMPQKGVVECVVCTKVIPKNEKSVFKPLKNFDQYCICNDCLERAKSGEWIFKVGEPLTEGEPTPDFR